MRESFRKIIFHRKCFYIKVIMYISDPEVSPTGLLLAMNLKRILKGVRDFALQHLQTNEEYWLSNLADNFDVHPTHFCSFPPNLAFHLELLWSLVTSTEKILRSNKKIRKLIALSPTISRNTQRLLWEDYVDADWLEVSNRLGENLACGNRASRPDRFFGFFSQKKKRPRYDWLSRHDSWQE